MTLPPPFSLAKDRIYLGTHLKEELTNCFESYQRILYSDTGRVDRNVNTLLMVNLNPLCKR